MYTFFSNGLILSVKYSDVPECIRYFKNVETYILSENFIELYEKDFCSCSCINLHKFCPSGSISDKVLILITPTILGLIVDDTVETTGLKIKNIAKDQIVSVDEITEFNSEKVNTIISRYEISTPVNIINFMEEIDNNVLKNVDMF